ncbi:MAG: hypothetical protein A2Y38_13090 [Spirochaetes bacterium GWB1_59_5]|nr:MAG: hypothetical protein A2Y38_13090 [Spirochaetes bacterium GWB1_59_5]
MSAGWEGGPNDSPLPPQNLQVLSGYRAGVIDIRWDNPAILAGNSPFTVVGVNVYRSDASDRGPYFRLNQFPVGGQFYRDSTTHEYVTKEVIPWSSWVNRGDAPNNRCWRFCTARPIVKSVSLPPHDMPTYANAPTDVKVWINGLQVQIEEVFGQTREIVLINIPDYNVVTEKFDENFRLPTETDTVEVSYYAIQNFVWSGLDKHIFYRVCTVALDPTTPSGYKESPIGYCQPVSSHTIETLDYIWREAVRRNHWILQQGGERVKVFVRKTMGLPCSCRLDARLREWSKQPSNRCLHCFGTGFLTGYEGPYDLIVAPDDFERRISQGPNGKRKEHTGEVWTGPTPLLTQRDFLVKQTNERYSIGPVRRPTNRGNILQQHFNIGYLDEGDMRYQVSVDGTADLAWPAEPSPVRDSLVTTPQRPVDGALTGPTPWPVGPRNTHPMETEKDNTPDEVEQRGRSRVWENINS